MAQGGQTISPMLTPGAACDVPGRDVLGHDVGPHGPPGDFKAR